MDRAERKEIRFNVDEQIEILMQRYQGWSLEFEGYFNDWLSDRVVEMQNGEEVAFIEYFEFAITAIEYSEWRQDTLYNMRLIRLVNCQLGMVKTSIRTSRWLDKESMLARLAEFLADFNDAMHFVEAKEAA